VANPVSLNAKSAPAGNVSTDAAVSPAARAKLQLNASIMQSTASISIGSQNDPQALLYKSAITSINEALKAELGDNALQTVSAQDNSPEGTAGRIVSLATGFFDAFKKQNPGMEEDEALGKFMDTIKGGIEKGFKEARDILQGLKVLDGDIAANIDKTYELVMKGLEDFTASFSKPADEPPEAEA